MVVEAPPKPRECRYAMVCPTESGSGFKYFYTRDEFRDGVREIKRIEAEGGILPQHIKFFRDRDEPDLIKAVRDYGNSLLRSRA